MLILELLNGELSDYTFDTCDFYQWSHLPTDSFAENCQKFKIKNVYFHLFSISLENLVISGSKNSFLTFEIRFTKTHWQQ